MSPKYGLHGAASTSYSPHPQEPTLGAGPTAPGAGGVGEGALFALLYSCSDCCTHRLQTWGG